MSTTISNTSLRLTLPDSLYAEYERQALESGKEIEEVILSRLTEFRDQSSYSGRSIKLSSSCRQTLEKVFGRSFKDGDDLTRYLESVYTLTVGGVDISLSSEVLRRLKERAIRRPFEDIVREVVVKQLEHHVGLR